MENLWSSVFTPGTTPTLLVATNCTFALLQAVLFALLIATYSIHFLILSVLCGGLWYSINWFAIEIQAAQAKEAEAERLRAKQKKEKDWKTRGEVADSADDEGEDTETEGLQGMKGSGVSSVADTEAEARAREQMKQAVAGAVEEKLDWRAEKGGNSTGAEGVGSSGARQRRVDEGDRSGEVSSSTDSEWEKVDR